MHACDATCSKENHNVVQITISIGTAIPLVILYQALSGGAGNELCKHLILTVFAC